MTGLDRESAPEDYDGPVAADYPDCLVIVREKVRPERQRKRPDGSYALRKPLPQRWWHYAEKRPALYAAIAGLKRVLVRARIANMHSISWVPAGWVYNEKTVVFVSTPLALLQSSLHEVWAREYSSTLRTDMQYTPSDCFESFPFPLDPSPLEARGARYDAHRGEVMLARQEGLTKTYNRFHEPDEHAVDIQRLRDLHVEMDQAVANAYGWDDLSLSHSFHETKQGLRFTVSAAARREILDRLLELNHTRYKEEVQAGLHDERRKAPGRKRGRRKAASPVNGLFDEP